MFRVGDREGKWTFSFIAQNHWFKCNLASMLAGWEVWCN